MKFLSLILALTLLFSCSRQDSASSGSDSDTTASPQKLEFGKAPEPEPITLTAVEQELINWSLLKAIHEQLMGEDSIRVAYKENIVIDGANIKYTLLRHNGTNAGWRTEQDDSGDVAHYVPLEETESTSDENGDGADDSEKTEGDREQDEIEAQEMKAYTTEYGRREIEIYENEIDTLTLDSYYVAYLAEGRPEATARTVKIVVRGSIRFENYYTPQMYGELKKEPFDMPVYGFTIETGHPIILSRDQIRLRAKMANLTEADLRGYTKEDLGYIRNEIFATHGHTFKTAKMAEYFAEIYWHHAVVDDATSLLNNFEKRNVEFIKEIETQLR